MLEKGEKDVRVARGYVTSFSEPQTLTSNLILNFETIPHIFLPYAKKVNFEFNLKNFQQIFVSYRHEHHTKMLRMSFGVQ